MTATTVTLQPADDAGLDYVERLLEANDLPAGDARISSAEFYVAFVDGGGVEEEQIGVGGLEPFDRVGLLRSVVVERAARGNGYGAAICAELEGMAAASGLEAVYLLTTSATEFFLGRGYETVPRESAPEPIRETRQFAELCPASADCLRRSL